MLNNIKRADIVRQGTLGLLLLFEIILFSILSDKFFTSSNLINILRQVAITGISSVGMFIIILLGAIDLSVGSMYAFIGVISAYVFNATKNTWITFFVALALGTLIGLFNGAVTAKFKIPAFITTLATMTMLRGAGYVMTGGTPIGVSNPNFTVFGSGYVFNMIPIPVIIMVIVVSIGYFFIGYTRFGRYIYACGGNEQASLYSGLKTDRIKISVFTIAGCLNGLAAIVLAGRLGGGLPASGNAAEMDVITAVVLGGTSMNGGKGKLWGVITGVLLIGILTNGLTMINISTYWQQIIKGIIILLAVIFDIRASNKS
jgi:ribose transport system permease protein